MWCLAVFQHDCMASTFPKVKKSYSWETSSVSKEEVVYFRPAALYSDWIARSKRYGGITKRINFNYLRRWNQVKALSQMTPTWKSMRSVTHFLRYSSLKCSKQTLTVRRRSWTPFLRLSSPQRRSGKLTKTLSLLWKISLPSSGIQELKNS